MAKDAAGEADRSTVEDVSDGQTASAADVRDMQDDADQSTDARGDGAPDSTPLDGNDGPEMDRAEGGTDGAGLETAPEALPEVSRPKWAPSDLAGLQLWLDASELSTGTLGAAWRDKSGQGHDASPLTTGAPQVIVDGGSGLSAVEMLGVDHYLTLAGDFPDFTPGMSVFMVVFPRASFSTLPDGRVFFTHLLDLGPKLGFHEDGVILQRSGPGESDLGFYVYLSGETANGFIASEAIGNFSWQLFEVTMDAGIAGGTTTARMFRNGVPIALSSIFVPRVVSRKSNLIGGSNFRFQDGSEIDGRFRGRIGEVVMFARQLPDPERRKVEDYLSAKWHVLLPLNP